MAMRLHTAPVEAAYAAAGHYSWPTNMRPLALLNKATFLLWCETTACHAGCVCCSPWHIPPECLCAASPTPVPDTIASIKHSPLPFPQCVFHRCKEAAPEPSDRRRKRRQERQAVPTISPAGDPPCILHKLLQGRHSVSLGGAALSQSGQSLFVGMTVGHGSIMQDVTSGLTAPRNRVDCTTQDLESLA